MRRTPKQKIVFGLKIFSIFAASLVLAGLIAAMGTVYWVLNYPQSAWNFVSKNFLPKDLIVTWEKIDFDWHMTSWREWDFHWSAQNLIVVKEDPEIGIGIISAEASWVINIWSDKPVFDFERFALRTREKSYFQLTPSEDPSPEQSIYQMAEEYLGYLSKTNTLARINTVEIDVAGFQLRVPESTPWNFSGTVFKNHEAAKDQEIHFDLLASSEILTAKAKGVIDSSLMNSDRSFLQAEADVTADAWSVKGSLLGVLHEERLEIRTKPRVRIGAGKKPIVVNPDLQMTLKEDALDVKTRLGVTGIPGPIVRLDKISGEIHIPLQNDVMWVDDASTVVAHTPVDLFLIDKNMRVPLEKACRCKLPEEFKVSLSGKAWLARYFSENRERAKIAEARVEIESVKNKLFSADIAGGAAVFKEAGAWQFEPRLDARVIVHSFQGLRQYMDAKGILIPAPLDILEGTIRVTAVSPVDRDEKTLHTSVQVATDLQSPTQKVAASAEIILQLANTFKSLDVDIDALIKTLKLDLPPLDPVLGVPALSADSRILREAPVPSTSNFKVRVVTRVRTATPGSIQLSSKYASPHVPVTVSLNAKGAEASGFVRVEPFTINYLRRKIFVEKINVTLTKNEEEHMPLDGRVRIDQGGYKIFIGLSGTTQSPNIKFSSEPNLSKDDIISVLLYGRVSDQLVSNEAENAGNLNAALADRAVGLFGLWAFASTPIQSFSYNATTKVYTATVDLGGGVTAGVGTNWEQATNFELRKRVSRRWMLTATWAPNQYNRQEGRLVLQWEKRF